MLKNETKNYYYAWVEEEEKWYYSMNKFDLNNFPFGFVDYEVEVKDGIIVYDSYSQDRVGKNFSDFYHISLWNN